jgi:hypothetical protein
MLAPPRAAPINPFAISVTQPSRDEHEDHDTHEETFPDYFVIIVSFRLRQGFGGPP